MANSEGGSMSSGDESELDSRVQDLEVPEKKRKPGIIYLSSVPEGMNVSATTAFFNEFGRVGRVFLQPDAKMGMRHFTEGWIEFMSKKVAKRVAEQINNTPVGGKRKHKAHYSLWNIKYLPRFKWVHLSERLAYEKAVKQQRMRTEISQVKRETEHFKSSVRQQQKKKKRKADTPVDTNNKDTELPEDRLFFFKQEETYSAKRKKLEEEGGKVDGDKEKSKKSKKEKKSKEKKELSPQSKVKKDKKVPKKKKKDSGKKSEDDSSNRKRRKSSDEAPPSSHAKKPDAASRKRAEGAIRRKSGEGDRAAFLKSVFGGGT